MVIRDRLAMVVLRWECVWYVVVSAVCVVLVVGLVWQGGLSAHPPPPISQHRRPPPRGPSWLYPPPTPLLDLPSVSLLVNTAICGTEPMLLVIVVISHPSHIKLREAQRTHISEETLDKLGARRVFILGDGSVKEQEGYPVVKMSQVLKEAGKHRDLVVANFTEHYRNLTYKHALALSWPSTFCPSARYILKMDDDIMVDVWGVAALLRAGLTLGPLGEIQTYGKGLLNRGLKYEEGLLDREALSGKRLKGEGFVDEERLMDIKEISGLKGLRGDRFVDRKELSGVKRSIGEGFVDEERLMDRTGLKRKELSRLRGKEFVDEERLINRKELNRKELSSVKRSIGEGFVDEDRLMARKGLKRKELSGLRGEGIVDEERLINRKGLNRKELSSVKRSIGEGLMDKNGLSKELTNNEWLGYRERLKDRERLNEKEGLLTREGLTDSGLIDEENEQLYSGGTWTAGLVQQGLIPHRGDTKWKVTKQEYPRNRYPDFLSGWAYIATQPAAAKILQTAASIPPFWIDDVHMTGTVAIIAGVPRYSIGKHYSLHSKAASCCLQNRGDTNLTLHRPPFAPMCGLLVVPSDKNLTVMSEWLETAKMCHERGSCPSIPSSACPFGHPRQGVGTVIRLN